MTDERNARGQFVRGNQVGIGRPKGVPNAVGRLAQEWALEDVDESWEALKRISKDGEHPQQFNALKLILSYAHGKPTQHIQAEVAVGRVVTDEEHEAALTAIRAGVVSEG